MHSWQINQTNSLNIPPQVCVSSFLLVCSLKRFKFPTSFIYSCPTDWLNWYCQYCQLVSNVSFILVFNFALKVTGLGLVWLFDLTLRLQPSSGFVEVRSDTLDHEMNIMQMKSMDTKWIALSTILVWNVDFIFKWIFCAKYLLFMSH